MDLYPVGFEPTTPVYGFRYPVNTERIYIFEQKKRKKIIFSLIFAFKDFIKKP